MDLILGACAGYPARRIRHFVESLRRWYDGEVVFVTAALPPDTTALLDSHGVGRVDIDLQPPFSAIQNLRFPAYRDILRARPEVRRAMMVDVRDIWFQANPFPALPDAPLVCFLEEREIIGCKSNRTWIQTLYGEARLREIGRRAISCSGTVAGTRDGLIHYLDLMTREIEAAAGKALPLGIDQGMHNHLLAGDLPDAVLVPNRTGAVQTLHYQTMFRFDREGRLLNEDGRICPVIHQFDRHPQFLGLLGIGLSGFLP